MPRKKTGMPFEVHPGPQKDDKGDGNGDSDGGGVDTIAVMANGAKAHLIPNEKKANDIINNLRKSKNVLSR